MKYLFFVLQVVVLCNGFGWSVVERSALPFGAAILLVALLRTARCLLFLLLAKLGLRPLQS